MDCKSTKYFYRFFEGKIQLRQEDNWIIMTTASIILIVFLSSALAREEKSYLLDVISEVENNNLANPKHVDLRQGKISEFLQSRLQRQRKYNTLQYFTYISKLFFQL